MIAALLVLSLATPILLVQRPRPHYDDLLPHLFIGQSKESVKTLSAKLGLSLEDEDANTLTIGPITPLNFFRREYQLVIMFDDGGKLHGAYEEIVYRYDDVGSRNADMDRSSK